MTKHISSSQILSTESFNWNQIGFDCQPFVSEILFASHSAYGSEEAHPVKSVQLLQILYGISEMNLVRSADD